MNSLQTADYLVFLAYFIAVSLYGYWVYHRRKSASMTTREFFLAEGSLTWWAIGASLIASNISAEHFIGMSGSGFAIGLAISTYEWMAAATLIVVAVFFIPLYIKNKIFTMPQFLAERYNQTVSTVMAVFWLLVYVFVNLTSIIYLGAIAINSISGLSFGWCIFFLCIFSVVVTLGGMKVIGYTDVVQVAVLLVGGLVTSYLALTLLSEHFGFGENAWKGLVLLKEKADGHFHMILEKDHPFYQDLPGLSVLIGGMWINNLNYFACNQYITQRALGADLQTARKGLLFAAFLKLLIPLIAVLPGIAMYVLYQEGIFVQEMTDATGHLKPDHAYPVLMNLLPAGLKGVAFAALTAAVVASLAGKANSISTIFSLDLYRKYIDPNATDQRLVWAGRMAVVVSIVVAGLVAPALRTLDQAYQFIQEYVGFISPGVLAIFLMGFFWKKTTSKAALWGALLTIPLSTLLKFLPELTDGIIDPIPFLDRMTIVFAVIILTMVLVSVTDKGKMEGKTMQVEVSDFKVSKGFAVYAILIMGILAALYTIFW
ncbi:MAG: sodium/solute symporter [Bacteroidetes bacterium]|nr:sodium/solute symporter [Bacteroidota bacterium]